MFKYRALLRTLSYFLGFSAVVLLLFDFFRFFYPLAFTFIVGILAIDIIRFIKNRYNRFHLFTRLFFSILLLVEVVDRSNWYTPFSTHYTPTLQLILWTSSLILFVGFVVTSIIKRRLFDDDLMSSSILYFSIPMVYLSVHTLVSRFMESLPRWIEITNADGTVTRIFYDYLWPTLPYQFVLIFLIIYALGTNSKARREIVDPYYEQNFQTNIK